MGRGRRQRGPNTPEHETRGAHTQDEALGTHGRHCRWSHDLHKHLDARCCRNEVILSCLTMEQPRSGVRHTCVPHGQAGKAYC